MIIPQTLFEIAKCRYDEAKILLHNSKPDGAVYLCGYAIELMLKRAIVLNLNWDGYPDDGPGFSDYKSFKVHDLDVLLHLSGLEKKVEADSAMLARWNTAKGWDSEIRYKPVGTFSNIDAKKILDSSKEVLNYLAKI